MFPVWLHGYPDSSIQATGNVSSRDAQHAAPADANMSLPKRVRCQLRLPKPEWFQQRVARLSGRGGQNASNVTIRALAKVQVASVWENILTYLNEEEFVGFEFSCVLQTSSAYV